MNLEIYPIHPHLFPAFEKKGKHSSYIIEDTCVYTAIALKIFKKLELQDLCQVKLVCKEWKHLIRNSFLAEEKAYTLALKLAIQQEDLIQEALYVEKLGDIYVNKGTSKRLLQGAGLYNYALQIVSDDKKKFFEEKLLKAQHLLIKSCQGKVSENNRIRKEFKSNRQALKIFREEIEGMIQSLPETPSFLKVKDLYGKIAQDIKAFFSLLVNQALDVLGPPPCEYAMVGFGSLAREEMTPYSDLEFGILIKEDNDANKKYFRNLTNLFHLKVINLGETILPALNIPSLKAIDFFDSITPRGFAFDGAGVEGKGCKTPLGNGKTFELIQTPGQMAQYIGKDEKGQWWHEKEPHLPMELLNFTHLLGKEELTEQYRQNVQSKLNTSYQDSLDLRQYLAKQHLVLADMEAFDPGIGDLSRHGMLFKVKNDFYRFPHLALDRLALIKGIEASDTFTRIDKLSELEVITKGATEKLKDWMSLALFMRLKTYSYYQAQKEMMNPLLKPFHFEDQDIAKKQFALDHKTLKKIKKIYHIFIPFYQAIDEFLAGNEGKLKSSNLDDNSPKVKGDIAHRLFQHEKARKCYLQAIQTSPHNSNALNNLGTIYFRQGNLAKALEYFSRAFAIDFKHYGKNHLMVARNYTNLGQIYQDQGNLDKALEYSRKTLTISLKHYSENNPNVAIDYSNLGQIYQDQGELDKAAEYTLKALVISRKLLGEDHPMVARNYNNLGQIYQDQGNLDKALEYSRKALTIDLKLFSENHPSVATCYSNLGKIYRDQGNLDKALECISRALDIDLKFSDENHPNVAIRYANRGAIYHKQGHLDKALEDSSRALDIGLKHYDENNPIIAIYYCNLGQIYKTQGELDKAAEYTHKALTIDLKLFSENHSRVATRYSNLGQIYQAQGELDKAAGYISKALVISRKLLGENHPMVATDYNNLGQIYQDQGNLDKALEYTHKALTIGLKHYGENNPTVAINYSNLGQIYQAQGELDKAAEYISKALVISRKLLGENHPMVATDYNNLGQIYQDQGNLDKALEYTHKALTIGLKHYGENNPTVAINYSNLGQIYQAQGELDKAAEYISKALVISRKLLGENHPMVATDYNNLGQIYKTQGELDKAAEYTHKALTIDLKLFSENHPRVATRYSNLGQIYQAQGELDKAAGYISKALVISRKLLGENHPMVATDYNNLGQICQEHGNLKQAFEYTKKALRISIKLYGVHHPTVELINANLQRLK
ncbi:tetratricopeptide repeat protein [Neochlamydia sp. AcF95]|uniref:tetratricopeptide repeat protein n=1 Tax=Neochlamydia sp. AcF95 TaxID=2795734 RepID=UPI001BC9BBDC|nr:tetratricopeptide repeat protein [Neochlamydia sp. AcF95]MBS4170934.1 hypothetical protein [Neochlamydia sp. AcF95]